MTDDNRLAMEFAVLRLTVTAMLRHMTEPQRRSVADDLALEMEAIGKAGGLAAERDLQIYRNSLDALLAAASQPPDANP